MQDIEKWFGRWNVIHLFHDVSINSCVSQAFLLCQYIMTRGKCGGSCFAYYTGYLTPQYKTMFFVEQGNHKHQNMLKPIPLSVTQNDSFHEIQLTLSTNYVRQGVGAQVKRVIGTTHFSLNKFATLTYHTLIQCSTVDHIDHAFHTVSTELNPCMNTLTIAVCTLDCAFQQ